jgi:hypothetical protein
MAINFDDCRKNFGKWESRDLMMIQGIINEIMISREVHKHFLLQKHKKK